LPEAENYSEPALIEDLKQLIYQACDLERGGISLTEMNEDDPLVGPQSPLGIDSLDAIEIVAAVEKKYAVRISSMDSAQKILKTIRTLAGFIAEKSPVYSAVKSNISNPCSLT
jgi:acyl carrier protein